MTLINATYDLRTGIGHKPDPLDYITKKTACRCAPLGTPHPLWTKFLDRVTNHDTELQSFLQRWCGYCCTGFTSEHVFVFAYGTGANGKSTFINTIRGILGDYTTIADMSTFLASNSERHPTDLAKLRGARLVVAIETQKGRRWDETKIKALTGGDKITARFMRQDFFDFTPTFKLMISGNHKPRLTSVDEAIKRRLLLVPFTVQIPVAERDKDLADKLKAEWPAILRWMIDGCLEWQRIGLAPPKTVLDATKITSTTKIRCNSGSMTVPKTPTSPRSPAPPTCSNHGKLGVTPATSSPAPKWRSRRRSATRASKRRATRLPADPYFVASQSALHEEDSK
jgi:putative DNA primase/helicase